MLKQICNHPAQYLHKSGPLPGRSGKLAALEELLDVIVGAGDSVLVFSQFVEMCSLIEAHLAALHIPTLFLHGGVPARKREEMVAGFQAGSAPVFLLSLKAGGVGLNLTRATHVIHYDRWAAAGACRDATCSPLVRTAVEVEQAIGLTGSASATPCRSTGWSVREPSRTASRCSSRTSALSRSPWWARARPGSAT